MEWLPLAVSLAVAVPVVPRLVAELRARGMTLANYRGVEVAHPSGVAIVACGLLAVAPAAAVAGLGLADALPPGTLAAVAYVVGVAALGLLDDLVGSGAPTAGGVELPRGWRGHARAAATGRISTGAIKAGGALGLALLVLAGRGLTPFDYAVAVLLLVLATNLFNLLDLRPGRSIKALVILAVALTAASAHVAPLWALGAFVGPVLVLLPIDLRERGMLGDTGANAVGGIAGLWLVLTLAPEGRLIALAVVAAATVYGEFRSISSLIEKTPGLRELDSLGRPSHA